MKQTALAPVLALTALLSGSCAGVLQGPPKVRHYSQPGRSDELPFSDAVLAEGTLYVAGTLGIDPRTGEPPEDPEAEIRLMLDSFRESLATAGMTMDDLVQVQVFAADLSLYGTFNSIYRAYFQRAGLPARAFVATPPLLRGARFEIMGIAVQQAGR